MSALSDACKRAPFANGTEGDAWMEKWCAYCTHDHGIHDHDSCGQGCNLIMGAFFGMPSEEFPWPEAWLPEPTNGPASLPSKLVCQLFEACTKPGCSGDPGAAERAERINEVRSYWRTAR